MKAWPLALLVVASLAGCAEDGQDLRPEFVEVEPGLFVGAGRGVLRGHVADAAGFDLAGARVSLLGTSFFEDTDGAGRFGFVNVSAGTHSLRISAQGHQAYAQDVLVEPGNITDLAIRLLPESVDSTGRQHIHDFWGGQETYTLLDATVDLNANRPDSPVPPAYWSAFGAALEPNQNNSMWPVPLLAAPDGPAIVLPGTGSMTLTATWVDPTIIVNGLGWCVVPTNWEERTNEKSYLCRAPQPSPASWTFDVESTWHDSGHAIWSQWEIYLFHEAPGDGGSPGITYGSVDVSAVLQRGELPPEPAHPKFWTEGDEVVFLEEERSASSVCCSSFPTGAMDDLVPPGTTRVRLEHSWTATGVPADAGLVDYQLMVRTAGMNPQTTYRAQMLQPDPVEEEIAPREGRRVYELEISGEDADPFYLTRSSWRYSYYNTNLDSHMYDVRGGSVEHSFRFTAYRDA